MLLRNPIMQLLKKLSRKQRIWVVIGSMAVSLVLLLIMQISSSFSLPSRFQLFGFLFAEWICSNAILYSAISLKSSWKISTHNLLAWCWTIAVTIAIVLFFVRGTAALSQLEECSNLSMQGSPQDKSCTLYFYRVGGNFFTGQDIDVMLEMADKPGNETFVCHLEKVHKLGLVWKSNTSFSINGKTYIIENGQALSPADVSQ